MQVGIRDLKNKLTNYLEMAKRGHAVIITDRGAPVAVLHNLDQIEQEAGPEESGLSGWTGFSQLAEDVGGTGVCAG